MKSQFDDSEFVLPLEPAAQRTSQSTPHKQYAGPIAPAPSAPAKRKRAEELPRNSIDWETLIGGRWMTWVGAFTLLLAIGFGIHWAWTQLETPPWLRVVGFHLLGVAFLAAAHFLNRRGVPLAVQALVGLGIFTLYASAFAALHLYGLFSEQGAFVECACITALAIGLAIRANSPAVVLLGALGGYLTPILTAHGSGNYAGLFTYLAFLNVALVSCAVWRGWSFLKPMTLAATAIMFAGWVVNRHFNPADNGMVWGTEWFAVLHASIFLIASTIPPLAWKRVSGPADLAALAANSLSFVGFTWFLFRDHPHEQLALFSWSMAALHAALFGVTYARVTNIDRMPRVHLALAIVFLTLAIPLQIDDAAYWSATWCLEGLVFTAVGIYFADRQMCVSAAVVLGLALMRLVGWDWQSLPRTIGGSDIDIRFVMFLVAGILTMLAGGAYRLLPWLLGNRLTNKLLVEFARRADMILSIIGAAEITLAPMLQLHDFVYLAPLWAVEAFVFTLLGLLLRNTQLRATALVVFACAAVRLLGFDYATQPRMWGDTLLDVRSTAFFTVGMLALLCGGIFRVLDRGAGTDSASREGGLSDELEELVRKSARQCNEFGRGAIAHCWGLAADLCVASAND